MVLSRIIFFISTVCIAFLSSWIPYIFGFIAILFEIYGFVKYNYAREKEEIAHLDLSDITSTSRDERNLHSSDDLEQHESTLLLNHSNGETDHSKECIKFCIIM